MPKALRDVLGFGPGQPLELKLREDRLEVEAAPVEMRLEQRSNGPVAVPAGNLPPLTARLVRETLERVRR